MTSSIAGLAYYDGTTNVVIGVPQDSIGQVLPSLNEVIYTNFFAGVNADILFKNSLAGFEQDVVLRQQLPPPSAYGLGSNVWLQVWTAFPTAPEPQITQLQDGDQFIDFGMKMGKGKGFILGDESVSVRFISSGLRGQRPTSWSRCCSMRFQRKCPSSQPFVQGGGSPKSISLTPCWHRVLHLAKRWTI